MRRIIKSLASLTICAGLLLGIAVPAAADVIVNQRNSQIELRTNSCTGEFLVLSGSLHVVIKSNKDGSIDTHVNGHLTGTSEQGTDYMLNAQRQIHSAGPFNDITIHTVLVSNGSSPNEHTIITISADGTSSVEIDCRG